MLPSLVSSGGDRNQGGWSTGLICPHVFVLPKNLLSLFASVQRSLCKGSKRAVWYTEDTKCLFPLFSNWLVEFMLLGMVVQASNVEQYLVHKTVVSARGEASPLCVGGTQSVSLLSLSHLRLRLLS